MLNGKLHHEIVLEILSDKRVHCSREFLEAGLCEYRQPIYKLRGIGWDIVSTRTNDGRPAFQLRGRKGAPPTDLFQQQVAA